MLISTKLINDVREKLPYFIVGSFSTALVEFTLFNQTTIEFNDIDILCLQQTHKNCMDLYNYFKETHNVFLSFNWYSPQLIGCEEVIQEASLFNINRFMIDVKNWQIIYDKDTFKTPEEIVTKYKSRELRINSDCCTWYYRNFKENIHQLEKWDMITEDNLELLDKDLQFCSDEEWIENFQNSEKRYSTKPKEGTIHKEKPEGVYFMKYFDIKEKFNKELVKL